MATLLHEEESLIHLEQCIDESAPDDSQPILDINQQNSAAIEHNPEADPLQTKENEQRVDVDQLKAYIRTAFSNWRKQSSRIYRLITDSENIQQLKTERDILGVFMEIISSLREAYQQVQPSYDNIHQTIDTIEHAYNELAQRLSDTIVSLQSDSGSVISHSNQRKTSRAKQAENNENSTTKLSNECVCGQARA